MKPIGCYQASVVECTMKKENLSQIALKMSRFPVLTEIPQPTWSNKEPEVLLRVEMVGLCRTDLLIASGEITPSGDVILGHEFSGVVLETNGFVYNVLKGDLVAVDPTFIRPDGSDGFMGRDIDGCLTTYVIVPANKVFRASLGLSAKACAYLEPIAAALGGVLEAQKIIAENHHPHAGLLVGDNRIASLTAMILESHDIPFIQIAFPDFKELSKGLIPLVPWILETKLEKDFLIYASDVLISYGTLILKSRHEEISNFPARRWAEKQLKLSGIARADFTQAMSWLSGNHQLISELLGPSFALKDWEQAFNLAYAGETGKVFIEI